MRRLGIVLVAALLMLAFAAPVAARQRVREAGTFNSLFSVSTACSGNTCTDTVLDVFPISPNTIVVCLSEYTYNVRTGRVVSQRGGCEETAPSALTVSSAMSARLAPTDVTFQNCNQRRCTEGDTVTVSASDQATGPIQTATGRVTFNDGTCTTKLTFSDRYAEVAGTMTVDGTTLDEQGSASTSEQTTTTSCR